MAKRDRIRVDGGRQSERKASSKGWFGLFLEVGQRRINIAFKAGRKRIALTIEWAGDFLGWLRRFLRWWLY